MLLASDGAISIFRHQIIGQTDWEAQIDNVDIAMTKTKSSTRASFLPLGIVIRERGVLE